MFLRRLFSFFRRLFWLVLQQLQKDSLEKELELLKINDEKNREAIEEKYKSEGELKAKLLEASEKNRVQKEKEIRDKYTKQGLKDEEEKAILSIELASTYAKKSEQTERQKQIALLNVKLEYAKKPLKFLSLRERTKIVLKFFGRRN